MKTLVIKDLSITAALDHSAMAAVHGGTGKGMSPYAWGLSVSVSKNDFSFSAEQLLGQTQDTMVNNGNNVAFASGIKSTVTPHQTGKNTINFA